MTKSTITRERLEKIAAGRVDARRCNDDEIAMAITLLAAMDSEPVAWTGEQDAQQAVVQKTAHSSVIAEQLAHVLSGLKVTDHQRAVISCAVDRLNNVAQLLQLSPSALLVPEILDYQGAKELYNYLMTEEETNATVNGWNACRAAMLAAAQQEGK